MVIEAIDPAKDVDGFHPVNIGRLASRRAGALAPCTPSGCLILAKSVRSDLAGLEAVVIGRSNIVGKPMAQLLLAENCTVTIAHSRTRDLPGVVRRADLVVAAVGRAEMVRGGWIKPGAIVIDVGIQRTTGADGKSRLVGDVAYEEAVAGGRRHYAGARRRRSHDGRLPAPQHARGRARAPALLSPASCATTAHTVRRRPNFHFVCRQLISRSAFPLPSVKRSSRGSCGDGMVCAGIEHKGRTD